MNTTDRITKSLARWRECVASHDLSNLRDLIAEDAVFRSPVLWKPKEGAEMLVIALSAADKVFQDFTYHRQMTDGTSWALEFSARVGAMSLKGVDIIRFNADGRIEDFEVMVRPAKGLHALAEAMAKEMAAQGNYEKFIAGG
ncbi:MAG: nuclear transport factor 2 family protein [Blastocatellia bacterium]